MTTLFTQLSNHLEHIIAGVEMRRHARRDWMERLMLEQDGSHRNIESTPVLVHDESAQSGSADQQVEQLLVVKCH